MEFQHVSVLLNECLEGLAINENGIYIDGTAGGAGHSCEIAKRLTGGMLYSLDQDPTAIKVAGQRLDGMRATVVQTNFSDAAYALARYNVQGNVNGVLLDLGVSSHQLDEHSRGFSFHGDAPLDMRMSQEGQTAADLVNSLSREEIAKILREYGDEPYAWQIAGKICQLREQAPIITTMQLANAVNLAMPPKERRKDKNPSRRAFQAIRIAVNGEMDALDKGLDGLFEMLAAGGRMCIITFHSLEDRIVKQRFRTWGTACTCPPEFPVCVCGGKAKARLITKKPIEPTKEEQEINRRARSAKLRIIEKL